MRAVTRRRRGRSPGRFRLALMLAFAGVTGTAGAQQTPAPEFKPPAYKLFRYDEDYRYLQNPANRTDPWDPIKYVSLDFGPGWYVSFGGEARARFESYSRPNLGLQGQRRDSYLLTRVLLHADLHAGERVRTFLQLGSHFAPWKDAAAPPYLDRLDLQQAFIDLRLPLSDRIETDPTLRIGRQELAFGSQRLVSIRDAPNVRRNFDGIRFNMPIGAGRIDAVLARPVVLRQDIFDDPSGRSQALWGVYATVPARLLPGGQANLYYLGFENERARFASAAGEERRHTIGGRFFGSANGWDWDWEALGQFGTVAQQDIRAWGLSTDTGYTIDVAGWAVRAGLKVDFGSGDRTPRDRTLGTMNPLFPKLAYFNQAALLGPSNVIDLIPTLTLKPGPGLSISAGYGFLWRATTADAIYTGAGIPIARTAGQPGRLTARQMNVDISWQVDRHLQLDLGYARLDAAGSLKRAGGKDVDFSYLSATYKF